MAKISTLPELYFTNSITIKAKIKISSKTGRCSNVFRRVDSASRKEKS